MSKLIPSRGSAPDTPLIVAFRHLLSSPIAHVRRLASHALAAQLSSEMYAVELSSLTASIQPPHKATQNMLAGTVFAAQTIAALFATNMSLSSLFTLLQQLEWIVSAGSPACAFVQAILVNALECLLVPRVTAENAGRIVDFVATFASQRLVSGIRLVVHGSQVGSIELATALARLQMRVAITTEPYIRPSHASSSVVATSLLALPLPEVHLGLFEVLRHSAMQMKIIIEHLNALTSFVTAQSPPTIHTDVSVREALLLFDSLMQGLPALDRTAYFESNTEFMAQASIVILPLLTGSNVALQEAAAIFFSHWLDPMLRRNLIEASALDTWFRLIASWSGYDNDVNLRLSAQRCLNACSHTLLQSTTVPVHARLGTFAMLVSALNDESSDIRVGAASHVSASILQLTEAICPQRALELLFDDVMVVKCLRTELLRLFWLLMQVWQTLTCSFKSHINHCSMMWRMCFCACSVAPLQHHRPRKYIQAHHQSCS